MNGILLIDKEAGWTSNDVVQKLRGALHEKRVGHAGTLDPMATGLLTVFVGRATRAVQFAESDEKTYIAGLRLGLTTDTQDITGSILSRQKPQVSEALLRSTLVNFTGPQQQIPPMYSAVKIGGQKLYTLARKGKTVDRKPRSITIRELTLEAYDGERAQLCVRCSKGTYVRTLCHDIGEQLGCGGCLSALRRTRSGKFSVAQCVTMEQLIAAKAAEEQEAMILPVDQLFSDRPPLTLDDIQAVRFKNGGNITVETDISGQCRVYDREGGFLALGEIRENTLFTVKSFFEPVG